MIGHVPVEHYVRGTNGAGVVVTEEEDFNMVLYADQFINLPVQALGKQSLLGNTLIG